jgi:regulatory protein
MRLHDARVEERPYEKARQKAFRLLALRGRSVLELQKKLRDKGFEEPVVEKVVSSLVELKVLDDVAFAHEWARSLAANKLYGNRWIERSLREKGIEPELIKTTIAEIRQDIPEHEALRVLVKKKLKDRMIEDLDKKEKYRPMQSLMGKGFPADLIYNALRNKEDEEIDERE